MEGEDIRIKSRENDVKAFIVMLDALEAKLPKSIRSTKFFFYSIKYHIDQWLVGKLDPLHETESYLVVLKNHRNLFKLAEGTIYKGNTGHGRGVCNWATAKTIFNRFGTYPEMTKLLSDPNLKW